MLRLLSDHNFNGRILRGLRRRMPDLDVLLALDVSLNSVLDPEFLEWAAANGRVVLTHDVNTLVGFAHERVKASLAMPGVFLIPKSMAIGHAIDDLELAIKAQAAEDCKDKVLYFPL